MKPAASYHWSSPLMSWSELPCGDGLKKLENDIISQKLKLCFGHHLVKVGGLATELSCTDSLIDHQVNLMAQQPIQGKAGILAEYDDLPLQNNSVDLVLLTHILEYSADPHQVLREAHRVVVPNGHLILSVFNPVSTLTANKLWPFKSKSQFWQFRLFSIGRIKDWLNLLGFEVIDIQYEGYASFLHNASEYKQGRWANFKRRFFSSTGALCVISARKREWPLTPIRPRVRYKTRFSPAVTGANKVF